MLKMLNTTQIRIAAAAAILLSSAASASPITPAVRTLIPSNVQQIISIDLSAVKKFEAAMAFKTQVLPDNLKEFETALKNVGIDPDRDLDSLTFASFVDGKQGLTMVGVASGSFSSKTVLTDVLLQKTKPTKYNGSDLYVISKTMDMTFLNDNTLLLGDDSAVKTALNVRDGHNSNVDANREITDMIKSVQKAPVWSVLDQQGSQNMLASALGDASKLPDFESIKKQLAGSRYMMNFKDGFNLYVDVLTSDDVTSSKLSSLLKAGVLYKKVMGTPAQKMALENMTVKSELVKPTSNRSHLKMQFAVNQTQFLKLLHSDCFAAVSNERKELSGVTSGQATNGLKPAEQNSSRPE
jgi:hypothetical protein